MIIECPKCGFIQPKDRYCANCGIDVESFHAKPKPVIVRILNSPSLYVGLFVSSLVILSLIITTLPDSKIAKTAKSWVLSEENENLNSDKIEKMEPEVQVAQNNNEEMASPSETIPSENSLPTQDKKSENKGTEVVKAPEYLNVEFVEFSRSQLDKLYNQGKILAETNEMQVIIYNKNPGLIALKELDKELKVLPGGHQQRFSENPTQVFNFISTTEKGDEQGLSFQVSLNALSANNLSIEYEIFLNIKAGENNELVNSSLSGTYQFSSKSTLILSGILPRLKLNDNVSQEFQATPLSIMTSENFVSPDAQSPSEFLILISVK